jgi:signal transduction histidine kinase/ActR/RegA family two-component response regulator
MRSLAGRTLRRVALRISLVVAIATVLSYWNVRSGLEEQALEQLASYVEQRRERESAVFELASDHLEAFAESYRRRLARLNPVPLNVRFDALFERREDGTTRLREHAFRESGITGFIGKHVTIDDDLRRRLVVAFDVLQQYGPAWRSRFVNLYVVTPENAVLMYWPDQPWALHASDWEVYGKLALIAGNQDEVLVLGEAHPPPPGGQQWSDLYYDYGVNDWMVSATEPVSEGDRYLLSVGQDILLRELIERTLKSEVEGTSNLIFRADGRLIAHPRYMEAIQAQSGALSIQDAGDPHLERIMTLAEQRPADQVIVANPDDEEFLAVTQLSGPGWYLVTLFPQSIVAAGAFATARLILLLGAIALLLELGILFWVMRRQVALPLERLIAATREVASGRLRSRLEVERDDEIGELARAFSAMAGEIDAREATLGERSASLAEVNRQLARELEERERIEQEIARQREALHQSEKLNALGSLLAGVAHELNNPLSVVVGRSILLEEDLKGTPEAGAVASVRAAAERCARIVKTFLAMARQQEPSRQAVRIAEVIRATLEVVGYNLKRDQVELTLDLAEGLPEIAADPHQLTQVFTNLLVNAGQALAGCPAPRQIVVAARFDEPAGRLVCTVEDNGPGIPPEIASRVFEPFFTTKPEGQGTGLGLSVCRGLIEAHGGTIEVGQAERGGTRFEIRLPVTPLQAERAERAAKTPPPPADRQILIIEDEPEIAQMLVEVLAPLGHRVEIAPTGRQALERLSAARYDVVLTDLRMPGLDGSGLFRELEARDPGHAARLVFVTGDSLNASSESLAAETGRPVIQKPFTPEEVRRVVAAQLAEVDDTSPGAPVALSPGGTPPAR